MSLKHKHQTLESVIRDMDSALVAFSGGADSTLVLAVAQAVLGNRVLAVTGRSESLPGRELEATRELAAGLAVEHLIIATEETASPDYLKNPSNRCYHCKSELYSKLAHIARERNLAYVLNGVNCDDLGDFRPGLAAAEEAGVRSPLLEAGLNKQDVRDLSRKLNLPTWAKPAMACLSSRIPYGQEITTEKLNMVERAEDLLLARGFTQLRVRHHGDIARIELPREDLARFFSGSIADGIQEGFQQLGFKYITVDITGFRSGSLNEVLPLKGNKKEPCGK